MLMVAAMVLDVSGHWQVSTRNACNTHLQPTSNADPPNLDSWASCALVVMGEVAVVVVGVPSASGGGEVCGSWLMVVGGCVALVAAVSS